MFLLRHAESVFNQQFNCTGCDPQVHDAPLTPKGLEQAEAAAHHFLALKNGSIQHRHAPKRIVCSPYTRALQTASVVAKALGLAIEVTPLLGERRMYSCDVGTPASNLKQLWPDVDFGDLEEEWWPPKNETDEELVVRAHGFQALYSDAPNLLAVSHWYMIYALSGADCANAQAIWCNGDGRVHRFVQG